MSEGETKPKGSGWLNVAVDYGPLLVFLGVYRWFAPEVAEPIGELAAVIKGTMAFMVAAVVALAVSKWRLGKVSPMLWFSTALIVGFGALTVFFGDPTFVQLKPTIIYCVFGIALLVGVWRGEGEGRGHEAHRQHDREQAEDAQPQHLRARADQVRRDRQQRGDGSRGQAERE